MVMPKLAKLTKEEIAAAAKAIAAGMAPEAILDASQTASRSSSQRTAGDHECVFGKKIHGGQNTWEDVLNASFSCWDRVYGVTLEDLSVVHFTPPREA